MKQLSKQAGAGVACLLTGLYAANLSAAEDTEFNVSLGLGAGFSESIYQGIDDDTQALPLFDIEYGNFYLSGLEAGYRYYETDTVSLYAAIAGDDLDGERTDSAQLRDLGDVDSGTNLKLGAELETDIGILELSVMQDLSDEHEGTQVSFGWGVPLVEKGRFSLMAEANVSWLSDDLVNHYYGVSASQAQPGRAAYSADSAWVYGAGLNGRYAMTENWIVIGAVGYEAYSDEITDSSIVNEDSTVSAMLGVMYRF